MSVWLALDLGTTQWKAGIVTGDGAMPHVARVLTPVDGDGFIRPEAADAALSALFFALPADARMAARGIAVTGMAEAGLLLDAVSGAPVTPILPWHDRRCLPLYEQKKRDPAFARRASVTGLPNSYKYGVYKLLYLLSETGRSAASSRWLGLCDYAAYALSGTAATDPTLAARTYAYTLSQGAWDTAFLSHAGLSESMLPGIAPSGAPGGLVTDCAAARYGLPRGIPVSVCGHDHLCAANAVMDGGPGELFASLGTAQVLLSFREDACVSDDDVRSGLSFGPALSGRGTAALGSVQSAGGSVSLLRRLCYEGGGYEAMLADAARMADGPSGLLYFPYLAGSGAPHLNPDARGAFMGLAADTTRADMLLAVYEGIAMESRLILACPAMARGARLCALGGLAAHRRFLQTMADVLRLPVQAPDIAEGALLGAARRMAGQCGQPIPKAVGGETYTPREAAASAYDALYERGYLPMQKAVMQWCASRTVEEGSV